MSSIGKYKIKNNKYSIIDIYYVIREYDPSYIYWNRHHTVIGRIERLLKPLGIKKITNANNKAKFIYTEAGNIIKTIDDTIIFKKCKASSLYYNLDCDYIKNYKCVVPQDIKEKIITIYNLYREYFL